MNKVKDPRRLALIYLSDYLQKELGFPRNDFLEWLAIESGLSEKTLQRYSRGEIPMKRWSFKDFWENAERTIKQFLIEYNSYGKVTVQGAAEKWERDKQKIEEVCCLFFIDFSDPKRYEDFPVGQYMKEEIEKVLLAFREAFMQLPEELCYSMQRNFLAYSNITSEDIKLLRYILVLSTEEKKQLKGRMSNEPTESVEIILERLTSPEVRCWVDIRDNNYADTVRKGNTKEKSWERFYKQCAFMEPLQIGTTILFLVMTVSTLDPDCNPTESITVLPFTPDDIDLIMLFKYCLKPEAQKRMLSIE